MVYVLGYTPLVGCCGAAHTLMYIPTYTLLDDAVIWGYCFLAWFEY